MIDPNKSDDIVRRVGGRFRLTALIQKRWLDLLRGARPMVDTAGRTDLEVVVEEIFQGKVGIDYESSGLAQPD